MQRLQEVFISRLRCAQGHKYMRSTLQQNYAGGCFGIGISRGVRGKECFSVVVKRGKAPLVMSVDKRDADEV
jgi:hypothetical protein